MHPGGHTLIPISGAGMWLAYRDEGGAVHRLKLEVGKSYFIQPMVPHQYLVTEGVVESYFDPANWVLEERRVAWLDEQFFDDAFMEALAAAAGSKS